MKVNDKLLKYLQPDMTTDATYDELVHRINQRAMASRGGKILIKVDDPDRVGGLDYIQFNKDNIAQIFLQNAWKHTSIEDKIKACNIQISNNLTEDGKFVVRKMPRFSLIKRACDSDRATYRMYYSNNDNVVWADIDALDKMHGTEVFSVLKHECQHIKDYQMLDNQIIPDLVSKYSPAVQGWASKTLPVAKAIIDLPISGEIYNAIDKKYEEINNELKQTILLAKNRYAIAVPNNIKKPTDIGSLVDMNDYISTVMYYHSPLEMRARDVQAAACKELITESDAVKSSMGDDIAKDTVVDNNDRCNYSVGCASVLLDRPVDEAYDTFVKYTFYNTNAGALNFYARDKEQIAIDFDNVQYDMQQMVKNSYNNLQERRLDNQASK